MIIDSTAPIAPPLTLSPATDTGQHNNDNVTANNNSPQHAPPAFVVSGVEPNSLVQLFRDGQFVGIVQAGPGATQVLVSDNLQGVIPDGNHTYTARQVDLAGNQGSQTAPGVTVKIDTTAPTAPVIVLDPTQVSNRINGITYTMANGSPPHPAPLFDVTGVEPNAWVQLFRNGVFVGFAQAGTTGSIKIVDNLTGVVPDSPGGVAYQYTAKQIDVAGNQGPLSTPASVVVDTTPPLNPPIVLDPASDTGVKGDNITQITLTSFATFDVGTAALPVEQGATVNLYRNGQIVTTVKNVTPINGVVKISDTHSIADGTYTYGAQQQDAAGNFSGLGGQIHVTYVTVAPPAPTAPTLTTGGTSTSSNSPAFNIGNVVAGETVSLLRNGTVVATLPNAAPVGGVVQLSDSSVPNGVYSYSAFQTDVAGNTSPIGASTSITIGPGPRTRSPSTRGATPGPRAITSPIISPPRSTWPASRPTRP